MRGAKRPLRVHNDLPLARRVIIVTRHPFERHVGSPVGPTIRVGGRGISTSRLRHRCRQYGWQLTYSDFGGWNCTTQSSASQNRRLIEHISSHVGTRSSRDTETCSHPSPLDAMTNATDSPNQNAKAPLPPGIDAKGPLLIRTCSGKRRLMPAPRRCRRHRRTGRRSARGRRRSAAAC